MIAPWNFGGCAPVEKKPVKRYPGVRMYESTDQRPELVHTVCGMCKRDWWVEGGGVVLTCLHCEDKA